MELDIYIQKAGIVYVSRITPGSALLTSYSCCHWRKMILIHNKLAPQSLWCSMRYDLWRDGAANTLRRSWLSVAVFSRAWLSDLETWLRWCAQCVERPLGAATVDRFWRDISPLTRATSPTPAHTVPSAHLGRTPSKSTLPGCTRTWLREAVVRARGRPSPGWETVAREPLETLCFLTMEVYYMMQWCNRGRHHSKGRVHTSKPRLWQLVSTRVDQDTKRQYRYAKRGCILLCQLVSI